MMAFFQQLHWREPWWLLLAFQPLLLWLVYTLWQSRQLNAYAEAKLQPWVVAGEAQPWRRCLLSRDKAYVLAWLLLALAAAGPRLPLYTSQLNPDKGMNLMVVLDVSRSMTVSDILPNRLRRAEIELRELLGKARGQRVGIIVYAARAHVFVPLTWDFTALRYYLQSLDKLVLPTRGSNLADALRLAKDTLAAAPQYKTLPSAIVLISDGDFAQDSGTALGQLDSVAAELRQSQLPVYVLGVGSSEGGSIALEDGSWLSYRNQPVISHMDEPLLRRLAQATAGRYSRASDDDGDWRRLYDQGLAGLVEDDDTERQWRELYPWVLVPAVVLLFAASMPLRLRMKESVSSATVMVLAAALFLNVGGAQASPNPQNPQNPPVTTDAAGKLSIEEQAYQAFQKQEYEAAAHMYAKVPGYRGRLGEGAAYYRLEEYQAAARRFSDAVLQADSEAQRANALFDLGNSYFQQGDYETASRTFADVLLYQSAHSAARHNLAISETLHQQVTQVLMEQENAARAGRGPRSARAIRELNMSEDGSLTLDDSDENQPPVIPELPQTGEDAWRDLIRKGLQHVQVAGGGGGQEDLSQSQQDLAQASLFMLQIEDQPATLWQRLFETEEGFTAPQREPHEIPGVPPW